MSDNVRRFNEPIMVPDLRDANDNQLGGDAAGNESDPFVTSQPETVVTSQSFVLKRDVITLTNVVVTFAASSSGEGLAILTCATDRAKLILGASLSISWTTAGGFVGTENHEWALGTSENTNNSFIGDEENILASDDVAVTGEGSKVLNSGDETNTNQQTPNMELDGGDTVYLNVTSSAAITGGGTMTVNGTIEIIYAELQDN